jgi:hypothetical protein
LKNIKTRLIEQQVRLSDGSEAQVMRIEEDGFGNLILEDSKGRFIELTKF